MRYYGKVFGAVLGWMLLRHPAGALIGGLLGHVFDAGWLRGSKTEAAGAADDDDLAAYRTLGVAPEASDEEVERAFRRLISEYHPDKVAGAAAELRQLAQTRASAINQAYEAIQKHRRYRR